MTLAAIPLTDGIVDDQFPLGRVWYEYLQGLGADEIAVQLAALTPDPVAARFRDVPCEERMALINAGE